MSDLESPTLIVIAEDLEQAGLVWQPEVGDEISDRMQKKEIAILVDPRGMTPSELRTMYLWLPTVEQLVEQVEARQAVLCHMGIELDNEDLFYRTVLKAKTREIESRGESLRISLGTALRDLLLASDKVLLQ